ncbi:uncharacterized protein LOC111264448 isoform X2 [Varroa jacobsoni]|uniref:uncharacterized protein LOC111264448 isoform X2 n=1 Tax=Varroa jacobsoni TaxID=62625 RepID=UPI000BF3C653|nr:uncharacterized protein LOC111264448 isoform X2 [Varroa jacobsoni]
MWVTEAEHGYAVSVASSGVRAGADRGGGGIAGGGGLVTLCAPSSVATTTGTPVSSVVTHTHSSHPGSHAPIASVAVVSGRALSPVSHSGHPGSLELGSPVAALSVLPIKNHTESVQAVPHRVSRRARAKKPLGNRSTHNELEKNRQVVELLWKLYIAKRYTERRSQNKGNGWERSADGVAGHRAPRAVTIRHYKRRRYQHQRR